MQLDWMPQPAPRSNARFLLHVWTNKGPRMAHETSPLRPVYFRDLPARCEGEILQLSEDREIKTLSIDSRKSHSAEGELFFAIAGERHDGHQFVGELYRSGIRQFVIEKPMDVRAFPAGNFFKTSSSIGALQSLAAHHRTQFNFPVIGITGSNGKTIIKEWLYQLLSREFTIVKNPGSYNSQVGVPLSVWQMHPHHDLGIFEAGISRPGEMVRLAAVIRPTIGVFTNIGSAHDEGFVSAQQKIEEKAMLFRESQTVIACADHLDIVSVLKQQKIKTFLWGQSAQADLRVSFSPDGLVHLKLQRAFLTEHISREQHWFRLPFQDGASRENTLHCIALMMYLKINPDTIQERLDQLRSVPMRLNMKQGINNCRIIDDTYNNDLGGLQMSVDFLAGQQGKMKTLILSDILQSGLKDADLVKRISEMVGNQGIGKFIGIGPVLTANAAQFEIESRFYRTTADFLRDVNWDDFQNEIILVKGARAFALEKVVQRLQKKIHGTVMEINLDALAHNLNFFKSRLKPQTKVMVMVKAFAYGSGSVEVANLMQYHRVDYLGVAYADEGVLLRDNHITTPIMVMNPAEESFDLMLEKDLEPEIYSLRILKIYTAFLRGRAGKIHLKVDTGMHRLGFEEGDLQEVIGILKGNPNLEVVSVFSHLAGSDDPALDSFSEEQANRFIVLASRLKGELGIDPVLHLLNSSGILRLPQFQFDMVRLGIGLYGIDPSQRVSEHLRPAATLKTIVSQVRRVKAGSTIGYGRKGLAKQEMSVATLAIGYADGFSRAFSQGKGEVLIHGKRAPVVGNVCMDMTMVDVTGMDVREGDEIIIFGNEPSLFELAGRINTIPYEILTSTSERVKRVFTAESI